MLFIDSKLFNCIYSTKWWYTHVTSSVLGPGVIDGITTAALWHVSLYHQQKNICSWVIITLNWKGLSGNLPNPFCCIVNWPNNCSYDMSGKWVTYRNLYCWVCYNWSHKNVSSLDGRSKKGRWLVGYLFKGELLSSGCIQDHEFINSQT